MLFKPPHFFPQMKHMNRTKWYDISGALLFVIISAACSLLAIFSGEASSIQAEDLGRL